MEEAKPLARLTGGMAGLCQEAGGEAVSPDLLEACRRGEREAFEALFGLCADRVYATALHFVGNPAVAADVTQEVFLKLLQKFHQFRQEARFSTWLYRVVANTAFDLRRRTRHTLPLEESAVLHLPDHREAPDSFAARRQRDALVRRAVAGLSPRLRGPLVLRHVAGLSYEEIAETLGLSVGTVASRLNRAHARLARALGEEM